MHSCILGVLYKVGYFIFYEGFHRERKINISITSFLPFVHSNFKDSFFGNTLSVTTLLIYTLNHL